MLKKPNQKSITDAGITALAFVAGAKVSDGVAAIMPESTAPYKGWGLAALGIVLAASISGTTTTAKAAQSAALGMAAKQLSNEVTKQLKTAVKIKTGTTAVDKFTNGVVGHLGSPDYYLGSAWESGYDESAVWDRPMEELSAGFSAATMM